MRTARPGTEIVAILPDVLRTGTLYARWRAHIAQRAAIDDVDVYGAFDTNADVDVFVLRLRVRATTAATEEGGFAGPAAGGAPDGSLAAAAELIPIPVWWDSNHEFAAAGRRLRDSFRVSVGPVVPHRHEHLGDWRAYLHARDAKPWGEITEIRARRRFRGRVVAPPFIVVRRTSGPRDRWRALATVVNSDRPVAVENHLLVLEPCDGSVDTCRDALHRLKSARVNAVLNARIRCRHLTVGALGDIPWPEDAL